MDQTAPTTVKTLITNYNWDSSQKRAVSRLTLRPKSRPKRKRKKGSRRSDIVEYITCATARP